MSGLMRRMVRGMVEWDDEGMVRGMVSGVVRGW